MKHPHTEPTMTKFELFLRLQQDRRERGKADTWDLRGRFTNVPYVKRTTLTEIGEGQWYLDLLTPETKKRLEEFKK